MAKILRRTISASSRASAPISAAAIRPISRPSPTARPPKKQSVKDGAAIDKLQDRLYAEGKRALLVVLQGIDTAGKDGTIKHVFKETGPLGVVVTAFKQAERGGTGARLPLARAYRRAAPRLHRHLQPLALRGCAGRPGAQARAQGRDREALRPDQCIREDAGRERHHGSSSSCCTSPRRSSANACRPGSTSRRAAGSSIRPTSTTASSGTSIMAAYELMLDKCSTAWAPWHVIPADHKWARNAAIAAIVRETLEEMDPQYPKPDWDPEKLRHQMTRQEVAPPAHRRRQRQDAEALSLRADRTGRPRLRSGVQA